MIVAHTLGFFAVASLGLALPAPAVAQGCLPGLPVPGCRPAPPPAQPSPTPPVAPAPPKPPDEPSECRATRRSQPGNFVGLVAEDVYVGGPRYRECALGTQVESGVALHRQPFRWYQIEVRRGRYDFGYYDGYVGALARQGVRVLPLLFAPPRFHSSAPRGSRNYQSYPPKRNRDMARFAAALARRYGRRGSFWRANPDVPYRPVVSWQIWNEPNLRAYWPRGPDARSYARMLVTVGRAINRVDRRAEIVTAGLSDSRHGIRLSTFLRGLYRAAGRRGFDTVAVNAYGATPRAVLTRTRRTRRLMNARGGHRHRLWVTELGWASAGPPSVFTVDESTQARYVSEVVELLARNRRQLRLRGLVYYAWRDSEPYRRGKDFWGLYTGLLDRDGREKPALAAFAAATRALP